VFIEIKVIPLTALGKSLERIAGAVKIESHKLETLRQIEQHNRVIQLEAVEGGVTSNSLGSRH
jgi:hypothetical protein